MPSSSAKLSFSGLLSFPPPLSLPPHKGPESPGSNLGSARGRVGIICLPELEFGSRDLCWALRPQLRKGSVSLTLEYPGTGASRFLSFLWLCKSRCHPLTLPKHQSPLWKMALTLQGCRENLEQLSPWYEAHMDQDQPNRGIGRDSVCQNAGATKGSGNKCATRPSLSLI